MANHEKLVVLDNQHDASPIHSPTIVLTVICYRGRPSTLKIIVVCREGILELPLLRILSLEVKKKNAFVYIS